MSEQAAKPLPKASWRWPIIIIGLLATHTLLMIIVVLIATGGPSHSVMPNAYERSLQWDAEQAQLRQSEALGWTLVIEADRKPTPIGTRRVSFVLRDAQGAPVPEAVLEVSAFHRSFSKDVHRFRLEQKQDAFSTEMRLRHAGFWEFHCKVIAGERVFVTTLTPWIAEGTP